MDFKFVVLSQVQGDAEYLDALDDTTKVGKQLIR